MAPPLHELRLEFADKLRKAAEEAESTLDELIAGKDEKPIVRVEVQLRGREINNRGDLERVLRELSDRIGEQLDRGNKVRLS